MSKLLIAIVHNLDAEQAIGALEAEDHPVTMIPSIGGFLGTNNATLLIGAEDDAVPAILGILERHCSSREVELPLVLVGRLKDALPRIVRHGGATVLIADLESIVRI
ncbi:MAG: cyclic-di-AMP receptor [Chloroflexota bacterium]|nr:cyclic-di-AMP receptor [Chloroflexota bacterium]